MPMHTYKFNFGIDKSEIAAHASKIIWIKSSGGALVKMTAMRYRPQYVEYVLKRLFALKAPKASPVQQLNMAVLIIILNV